MKIIVTNHAEKRLGERNIPSPNIDHLKRCTKKDIMKIQKSFKSGFDKNLIYMKDTSQRGKFVYVCAEEGSVYILITAINIK